MEHMACTSAQDNLNLQDYLTHQVPKMYHLADGCPMLVVKLLQDKTACFLICWSLDCVHYGVWETPFNDIIDQH